jgi:hypothetical protein
MHAAASPHVHVPSVPQLSARMVSHAWQTEPPTPHAIIDCGRHDAPEQQPLAQLVALHPEHTPSVHISPAGQTEQSRPALPHALVSLPG